MKYTSSANGVASVYGVDLVACSAVSYISHKPPQGEKVQ